jgi:hypothetical protein
MQAKTGARAAETTSLLESFGIELSVGGLVACEPSGVPWHDCPRDGVPSRRGGSISIPANLRMALSSADRSRAIRA